MNGNRTSRDDVADRHSDTLKGKLAALDQATTARVTIVVSAAAAGSRCGHLVATWLANLMGRMAGVVEEIEVVVEGGDSRLHPGMDPRDALGMGALSDSVCRNAALSKPTRSSLDADRSEAYLRVGVGRPAADCNVYVSANAWVGYIGSSPGPECQDDEACAVGPVVAAALASGEVFKLLRATGVGGQATPRYYFDAFEWRHCDGFTSHAALTRNAERLRTTFTLAGVGAVGTAFLLTLWSTDVTVDAIILDADDVARTNLNRYPLFSVADIRLPKVERAKALLERKRFTIDALPLWWSQYQRLRQESPSLVVSAVDTNVARHQLQDALPRLIIGASTNELRVEVGRYDLASSRCRCLKCFNAPEANEDDAALQRRLLGMEQAELTRYAANCGVALDQLAAYVEDLRAGGNGCALLAGESLDNLRVRPGERQFSVSFVSAFAGAMLSAQVIREAAGIPLLVAPTTRAVFQMWCLAAVSNRLAEAPVDPTCFCSTPLIRQTFSKLWESHQASQVP